MKKIKTAMLLAFMTVTAGAFADAQVTTYPVVLAHGMAGWDNILGVKYFGDVGDGCYEILGVDSEPNGCNGRIEDNQKTWVSQVTAFATSETRGTQLANYIETQMVAAKIYKVNLVGHSQGGFDLRKAAKVLYTRAIGTAAANTQKVRVAISISSPHRGSPVAKHVLNLGSGVTSVLGAFVNFFGNIVYNFGEQAAIAAAKQLVYDDYSSTDGVTTGAKAFNKTYPISTTYAAHWASVLTGQNGLDMNPALYLVSQAFINPDGDGSCTYGSDGLCTDGGSDGAAGTGNGVKTDDDDDGLVGINSQQMGYRLKYNEVFGFDDDVFQYDLDKNGSIGGTTSADYTSNINAPTALQMTCGKATRSSDRCAVLNQDHLDVVNVGPDMFDEDDFYGALYNYIAIKD